MAIEFDVQIERQVTVRDIVDGLAWFRPAWSHEGLHLSVEHDALLEPPLAYDFRAAGDAMVAMTVVHLQGDDDEPGLWACFAASRTDASYALAALLAASAARSAAGRLLDESNLLGLGREPSVDELFSYLHSVLASTLSLGQAGRKLVTASNR